MPQVGKINFRDDFEWKALTFDQFKGTYAKLIESNCDCSVEDVAIILGVKPPPKQKEKAEKAE